MPTAHAVRMAREEGTAARHKRKLVVVGDGECGKTCLLQRFCRDTYNISGYLPTVFDTDVIDVELDKTTVCSSVVISSFFHFATEFEFSPFYAVIPSLATKVLKCLGGYR